MDLKSVAHFDFDTLLIPKRRQQGDLLENQSPDPKKSFYSTVEIEALRIVRVVKTIFFKISGGIWKWIKNNKVISLIIVGCVVATYQYYLPQFLDSKKADKFSEPKEIPDNHNLSDLWGTYIFNINKKMPEECTIGKCPGSYCFKIALGPEMEDPSETRGVVFYMEGLGFVHLFHGNELYYSYMVRYCMVLGLCIGENGDELFAWVGTGKNKIKCPSGYKVIKDSPKVPVWVPFKSYQDPSEIVSKKVDVEFTILSDSINDLKLEVKLSEGTQCKREEFKKLGWFNRICR